MHLQLFTLLSFLPFYFSCELKSEKKSEGLITQTTHIYNENKSISLTLFLKLWHKDSTAIQEITGINTITDSKNHTTTNYPVLFYRFFDLKNKTITDFRTFTDTAGIIAQSVLPDSVLSGPGWCYYSEKHPVIKGEPTILNDTSINNINYRRYKLQFTFDNPEHYYSIGYFRCDKNDYLYSMEKTFSKKIKCILVKNFSYASGDDKPYASKEIDFTRDFLTPYEKLIFKAWEKKSTFQN